ncbi:MAG: hypothetical protein ACLSHC_12995 [Bilophila wadsworthia]
MSAYSLPVLMYHYVSRFPGAIAVSPEHFEDQCEAGRTRLARDRP